MQKLLLLIALAFSMKLSAQTVTLPFATDASGRIFFYAAIGPDTVSMLFNTYATYNRLSPDFSTSPLLKSVKRIETTDNTGTTASKSLYSGPLSIGGLRFSDAMFSLLPPQWKITRAGSLGMMSLVEYSWKIDMPSRQISLSKWPFREKDTGVVLKETFREGDYPMVFCSLLGGSHAFVLDWGSDEGFLIRADTDLGKKVLAMFSPSPKAVTTRGVNRYAVVDTSYEVIIPEIVIGNVVLKNQKAVIRQNAPSNLAGMQILRQFNAVFNFHGGKLDLILKKPR